MPILHEGRLVGRIDPKFDRKKGVLQIKRVFYQPGVDPQASPLKRGLSHALSDLATFLGSRSIELARGVSL